VTGIELTGIRHAFGRDGETPVLDDVDLHVPDGQFAALVGPSGCGKTTLLRMVAGLVVPDHGTVRVGDDDVAGRPGAVAFHPQNDLLLPWRRALGNAVVAAEVTGTEREVARTRARALWDRFGLTGFERAWPSQLSGGMRQRLALLRTFLVERPVLLLDEPFGALDAITRRDLHEWLAGIMATERRTVVLVTHDVEEALVLADRVVVMSDRPSRLVADLPVDLPADRTGLTADPAFVSQKAAVLDALASGHRRPSR
jgi:ABC-type nitrate/sulfonate/bicarbonate transport system ATPase subunit